MQDKEQNPEMDGQEEKEQAKIDYEQGKQFLEAGDESLAASAYHNALLGFEEKGDKEGIANAADKMGDICVHRQDYQGALKYFQKAYDICDELKDLFSLLSLQKKMASAYRSGKNYDKAVQTYLNIIDMYRHFNNPEGAVRILDKLAATYIENNEEAKAVDSYRTAAAIHSNFKHKRHAQKFIDKANEIEKNLK